MARRADLRTTFGDVSGTLTGDAEQRFLVPRRRQPSTWLRWSARSRTVID
jgi:hypothetical protein